MRETDDLTTHLGPSQDCRDRATRIRCRVATQGTTKEPARTERMVFRCSKTQQEGALVGVQVEPGDKDSPRVNAIDLLDLVVANRNARTFQVLSVTVHCHPYLGEGLRVTDIAVVRVFDLIASRSLDRVTNVLGNVIERDSLGRRPHVGSECALAGTLLSV